ncbi:DUF4231 domain-containing protein [Paenibacillus polysaccharolyticus]|uniref:DUF4231 domain-containing protein n=1 Tax=Paenibacillus polysaccharolyticus TaxID=582692 RepID=UPI00300963B4
MDIKYSSIQEAADEASIQSQRKYLNFIKIQLLLLFLTTLTSVLVVYNRYFLAFVLIFMVINLTISTIIKLRKYEKVWYDGRALAESMKTITWRYIMKAEPFIHSSEKDAEVFYIKSLNKVLEGRKELSHKITSQIENKNYISNEMRRIRERNFKPRLKFYIKERIEEQQKWYSKKSDYNTKWEERLFYFSIIFQVLAIAYIVVMLLISNLSLNLTAVFTSVVTLAATWLQTKQHNDLAQSYGVAAQELTQIHALGVEVEDESSLAQFVNDSENAISREHTLWTARKGQ